MAEDLIFLVTIKIEGHGDPELARDLLTNSVPRIAFGGETFSLSSTKVVEVTRVHISGKNGNGLPWGKGAG